MTGTPSPIQLAQLARLLGHEELRRASFGGGRAGAEAIGIERLRALINERLERFAQGLLAEAVASDDVVDAESAEAYLDDRLAFFGELLSEEQGAQLRELYMSAARRWG